MKRKKLMSRQKSWHRVAKTIVTPVIAVSLLLTSTTSYALAPQTAPIINLTENQGIAVYKGKSFLGAANSATILQIYSALKVPTSAWAKLRFKDKKGIDMGLQVTADAKDGNLTTYYMPCTVNVNNKNQAVITWSNGKRSPGCAEGIGVTSNPSRHSSLPKIQTIPIAQAKNLAIKENSNKLQNNRLFLKAEGDESSLRYYCSSVPDSGRGEGHIAAGLTSMEEACQQSQESCKTNNGSECSIATIGEWNLYDPNLVMSVTCADGKSSSKKVSGAEISAPGISNDALIQKQLKELLGQLGEILAQLFGIKPQACYLEVYHPDEILISPVGSQETSVVTTGLESGRIEVDVIKGEVKLRSVDNPEGIVASQGDIYVFDGEGSIKGRGSYEPSPSPETSPSPTYEPSPSPETSPSPTYEPSPSPEPSPYPILR
jgi:hypothetical protein